MRGIGEEENPGWTLQTFEAFMPKGLKAILDAIRDILQKGKVQSLSLEVGKPITYTQWVEGGPREAPVGMTLGDVARNVQMEEYNCPVKEPAVFHWTRMFLSIALRGLYVTHIGIGPETRFFRWLGVDEMTYGGLTQVFGAEIVRDKQIESDIVVLFAGPIQGGRPDNVTYALKHHLFSIDDLEQEELNERPEEQADGGGNHTGRPGQADGAVAAAAGGQQPANRAVRPGKGQPPQG